MSEIFEEDKKKKAKQIEKVTIFLKVSFPFSFTKIKKHNA